MVKCSAHRPRPVAPVRTPEQVLEVLGLATDSGRERVVALACLDQDRRPLTMFIVEGSPAGPAELAVAADVLLVAILDATGGQDGLSPLGAVVLATSRPGQPVEPTAADLAAWDQLDERFRRQGIALVDWFILVDGVAVSVATRAGQSSRWTPG